MPLICPGGFDTCTPNLAGRERLRMNDTDGKPIACVLESNLISRTEMHLPDISPSHSITAFAWKQPPRDVLVLNGLPSQGAHAHLSSHSILQMTCLVRSKAEI